MTEPPRRRSASPAGSLEGARSRQGARRTPRDVRPHRASSARHHFGQVTRSGSEPVIRPSTASWSTDGLPQALRSGLGRFPRGAPVLVLPAVTVEGQVSYTRCHTAEESYKVCHTVGMPRQISGKPAFKPGSEVLGLFIPGMGRIRDRYPQALCQPPITVIVATLKWLTSSVVDRAITCESRRLHRSNQ